MRKLVRLIKRRINRGGQTRLILEFEVEGWLTTASCSLLQTSLRCAQRAAPLEQHHFDFKTGLNLKHLSSVLHPQ